MEITFDQAIELLEITNISNVKIDDVVQIEKKSKKRWHPDRVTHLNDPVITLEYTQKFQQIELACQLISSYLNGTYQAGDIFSEPIDYSQEEPAEIIRQNAPEIQTKLREIWDGIKIKKYKWYSKEVLLSDGFVLKDLLHEDFKEDIAMLSIVSLFYGLIILSILGAIAGAMSPVLGILVGIITLLQFLSCVFGFLPLSRFWLPTSVSDVMIKFINFGLGIYNWAENQITSSSSGWVVLLVRLPVLFAKLVKYVVLFPLYELAKVFIGDKIVGVVKQNVNYYADGAEWYIDELIHEDPRLMTTEELFHLSYFYGELMDFRPGEEYFSPPQAEAEKEKVVKEEVVKEEVVKSPNSEKIEVEKKPKIKARVDPKAKKAITFSIGALLLVFLLYKGIGIYNKRELTNASSGPETTVNTTPPVTSNESQNITTQSTSIQGSNNNSRFIDSATVIADDYLSLKSSPDISAARILTILPSETVYIISKTNVCKEEEGKYDCWYQASYRGNEGYVFGAYLRFYSDSETNPDFYIVTTAAFKTESEASNKVRELKSKGYQAGYLWIPDYPSLSGAQMYTAYIGPFYDQYDCEVATENYRKVDPSAYGVLVSKESKRVQINGIGKISTGSSGIQSDNSLISKISCYEEIQYGKQVLTITGDNVRVRSESNSSTNANILFKLGKNDNPIVLDKQVNSNGELWYNICFDKFQGWVSGQFSSIFIFDESNRNIISKNSEEKTHVMVMLFQDYSEGDYPHLIFKDSKSGDEYDFMHLSYNNYDDVKLLLDDNTAGFGLKSNPQYLHKTFLISAKKKNVKSSDLNGNTIQVLDWCITGLKIL